MTAFRFTLSLFTILLLVVSLSNAQTQTVGLFDYQPDSFEGYTLYTPNASTSTFLLDNYGREVHSWSSSFRPGNSVYLLESGVLLRTKKIPGVVGPGAGGGFQEMDWDGTILWEYDYNNSEHLHHHDVVKLPNGNVLLLAWDYRTKAEAIAAGMDSTLIQDDEVWSEHIIEVQQTGLNTGMIVWEWYIWDHFIQDNDATKNNFGVVTEHPELCDINSTTMNNEEILHANAIAYNADFDQIVISMFNVSEVWIIDHSTTTAEAASHTGGNSGKGGDILYRWGNPQIYDRGATVDRRLYIQHSPYWIEDGLPGAGNLLIYNNGTGRPDGNYSTIDEVTTPVDVMGNYPALTPGTAHAPADQTIVYGSSTPPDEFYSALMSSAQRLPNGNTLICTSLSGRFFEVTPAGDIVWDYVNPVVGAGPLTQGDPTAGNTVFRCLRYGPDYPGLAGQNLTPGGLLELYPIAVSGVQHLPVAPLSTDSVIITATITSNDPITVSQLQIDTGAGLIVFDMFDDGNHHDELAGDNLYGVSLPPFPDMTDASYFVFAQNNMDSSVSDPPNAPSLTYHYSVNNSFCCLGNRGNANGDLSDNTNISDVTFLVDYLFGIPTGPAPTCPAEANANADLSENVNIADITYLVAYLFGVPTGPAPGVCP